MFTTVIETFLQDSHAKQIEQEQRTKTKLVEELSELTGALKETTISINKSVNLQNLVSVSTTWKSKINLIHV